MRNSIPCSRHFSLERLQVHSDMARRMRDKAFRDDQWAHPYTGPVEPINRFIDDLGAKDEAGHPRYIPPMYRGVDALSIVARRVRLGPPAAV